MQKIDFQSINTTDQFYEAFKLPRLKQHRHGKVDIYVVCIISGPELIKCGLVCLPYINLTGLFVGNVFY